MPKASDTAHVNEADKATSSAAADARMSVEESTVQKGSEGWDRAYKVQPQLTACQAVSNAWHHLNTISRHKWLVFELCARCGIPWQGIVHDLSKFSPDEFMVGVKYFQGNRSPNAAERHENGYSRAWIHHKGRNKHHYEYWLDMHEGCDGTLYGNLIPTRYMVEMFCDRVAASKVYEKSNYRDSSPLDYFKRELTVGNLPFHPESAAFLYVLLEHLAEHGEDETLRFIRQTIVEPRFIYAPGATFD